MVGGDCLNVTDDFSSISFMNSGIPIGRRQFEMLLSTLRGADRHQSMCTVTIVPDDDGFRLMCNRDERRDRPVAIPPIDRRLPHRTAIYPQDPLGGGTWVGVNDAGLAAALLNRSVNAGVPAGERPLRSRGLIIPPLLDASSVTEAAEMAADLDPRLFNPFRVVVLQRMVAWLLTSDGVTLSVEAPDVTRPLMLTSSSLGDALVFASRHRLFEQLVMQHDGSWLQGQADFHDHQWPSRPEISVRMERPDARTVSRTTVDVTSRGIELDYHPIEVREQSAGTLV